MTQVITAGDILVQGGTYLPGSLRLQTQSDSNEWTAVSDNRTTFEKAVQEEGWTFFFLAGEIKATVFGFDKEKALRSAVQHLIKDVKFQHCNSLEIMQITNKSFFRVPYVSVSAHVRHLQKGLLFSGRVSDAQSGASSRDSTSKRRLTAL